MCGTNPQSSGPKDNVPMNKLIVLAEDDTDLAAVNAIRLEISGYEVMEVSNGQDAITAVKEKRPDLLITDLMMPKITGYEVCRMLRFDDSFKNMPIIVLTSLSNQDEREMAVRSGADAVFVKPFELNLLLCKIRELLGE